MTPPTPTATPELLLAHAGWIRRLARRLVADAHAADDLAQQTWLQLLQHPPQRGRPLRGWIATVMRNVWHNERRGAQRRRDRETRSARGETTEPDLVPLVAAQREVVDAVLALDEPYRTTLLLRWFEDCTPQRIAARQGVPVATVKTRLQRGLERLRLQLDRRHGGARGAWLAVLLPLSWPPLGAPLPWALATGALTMPTKWIASLLVLAAAGASWLLLREPPAPAPARAAASSAAAPAAEAADTRERAPDAVASRTALAPAARAEPAAEPAAARTVHGRVVDVAGRPVAGVPIGALAGGIDAREAASAVSDAGGSFALAAAAGRPLGARDPRWATVLAGLPVPQTTVVVAPAIALAGRVVTAEGAAVAGADVQVALPSDLRARIGAVLDFSDEQTWEVATGEDGAFALPVAPAVAGAELRVRADGFAAHAQPLPQSTRRNLWITLARPGPEERTLLGTVVDAAGAPVEDALVALGALTVRSDAHGAFAFELDAQPELPIALDLGRVRAVKAGHLPGEVVAPQRAADGAPQWPAHVEVRLGGAPLSIAGHVVDAQGRPRAGIRVWVADPTFFGLGGTPDEGGPRLTHCENVLAGAAPGWRAVDSGEDGTFVLDGLLPRPYTVAAMDAETLLRVEVADVPAGSRDVRVVIDDHEQLWPTLRGRVVDARGNPLAGIRVHGMCDAFRTQVEGQTVSTHHAGSTETVTDADGRFELERVPRALVYLRLDGRDVVPLEYGRHVEGGLARLVQDRPQDLEITMGRRCPFRVELTDPTEADEIGLLDAHGEPVEISEFRGHGRREGRRQPLQDGKSNPLGATDAAVTLVLYRAGAEVRRAPLTLEPGEQIVVRP